MPPRDEQIAVHLDDVGGLELAGYADGQALAAELIKDIYRPIKKTCLRNQRPERALYIAPNSFEIQGKLTLYKQ